MGITWNCQDAATLSATVLEEDVTFSVSEIVEQQPHVLTPDELSRKARGAYLYFPSWNYKPTDRLKLSIDNLPHASGVRHTWSDGSCQRVEACLGSFVVGLHTAALALKKKREQRLQWEREWRERKQRDEAERRRQNDYDRKSKLVQLSAEAWSRSNRIRDFAMAVALESENPNISASQKRYMKRFARWTKGYATRLNPLNRMDTVLKQFRGLQDSDHLDDARDSLDEQESEARIA
jgi:Ni/Co efflux regulator RcnB